MGFPQKAPRFDEVPNAQNNPAREALGSPARFYFPRAAECFWWSGACARGVAIVFLDLYGVLVDSEVMNRGYNARIAAIHWAVRASRSAALIRPRR